MNTTGNSNRDIPERISFAQSADREVFGMDTQLSGSLKLTASYDIFNRLITPTLHEFTDRYPGIELDLLSSTGLALSLAPGTCMALSNQRR